MCENAQESWKRKKQLRAFFENYFYGNGQWLVGDIQINGCRRPISVCLFSCGGPNKNPFDTCIHSKFRFTLFHQQAVLRRGTPHHHHLHRASFWHAERLPTFIRLAAFKQFFDYVKHSLERQDALFENMKPATYTCTKSCQHTYVCVCVCVW